MSVSRGSTVLISVGLIDHFSSDSTERQKLQLIGYSQYKLVLVEVSLHSPVEFSEYGPVHRFS